MKTKLLQGFVILIGLIGVAFFAQPASAATYTVTNTSDSGAGSLRQAIIDANANVGADTIDFNIAGAGPHTITVGATELPEITGPTIVDGTTQSGSSCGDLVPATLPAASNTPHNIQIILDGTNITWSNYDQGILHFTVGSDGSEVRGFSFINAGAGGSDYISGVSIDGTTLNPVDDYLIECSYFGISADGTTEASNYGAGINASYRVSNIVVRNNLISAAAGAGLVIYDNDFPLSSTGNIVEENLFGTLADGLTAASYNQQLLQVTGTAGASVQRNIIGAEGITFAARVEDSDNSTIQNNYVGLNINQGALPNAGYGIWSYENTNSSINNNLVANNTYIGIYAESFSPNNQISNNTIYNNPGIGAFIGLNNTFSSNNVYSNDGNGVNVGSSGLVLQNNIYSNGGDGVNVSFSQNAVIRGNNVGLDGSDTPAGNGGDGIEISSNAFDTIVGGSSTGEGNFVADNVGNGIHIFNDIAGSCGRNNVGSLIFNNYVGTNTTGAIQTGFGNGLSGIAINEVNSGDQCGGVSVYNHQVGGDNAGEQNIIAGNNEDGIRIYQADNAQTGADVFSGKFLPNSIFGNGNLGINLAFDNDNDGTADTDLGPNPLNNNLMSYPAVNANYYLNRPTINSATFSGNDITVNYDFQANQADESSLFQSDVVGYRLDFYLNDAGQDGAYAGYSQGKTHIGSFIVNGSETNASHVFTSPVTPTAGQVITSATTVLWLNREAINCGPPTYYGPPYGATCM